MKSVENRCHRSFCRFLSACLRYSPSLLSQTFQKEDLVLQVTTGWHCALLGPFKNNGPAEGPLFGRTDPLQARIIIALWNPGTQPLLADTYFLKLNLLKRTSHFSQKWKNFALWIGRAFHFNYYLELGLIRKGLIPDNISPALQASSMCPAMDKLCSWRASV